ncbi:MAG: proline--tRNA ligase, partial [Deltaproteobacteria bacterium]|nr:proline--tRNA ligase [Deltaproteobacteria bacterium]
MRATALNIVTYREDPADAEVASHRLLLRAGLIHKSGAGRYLYAPLMWRVLRKIEGIIRQEMDRAGALEVQMPILQDKGLWEDSGRWDGYLASNTMFTLTDRRGAQMCLGPTHEEVITDYARSAIHSHKQLPVNYYQIHTKFRDEIRPRFGLMRVKEFLMKDAYSFDADEEGLDRSYSAMSIAYHRLFARMGLETLVVEADSGDIGGTGSQEFMVAADVGEDSVIFCSKCGYSANVERATSRFDPPEEDEARPMRIEDTPNIKTVDELDAFFPDVPRHRMVKTIHYTSVHADREEAVVALIRGDQEINEVKLLNKAGGLMLRPATEEEVRARTGAEVGFAGPVGLEEEIEIIADETVRGMTNVLCGLNRTDAHA